MVRRADTPWLTSAPVRPRRKLDRSDLDRIELEHAPKATGSRSGSNDRSHSWRGNRHGIRRGGGPPYAAFHRRELDWPPTDKRLHQRRWGEHHHPHPLARVEAFLRLRSRDERHPGVCSKLRQRLRDPSPYHPHFVSSCLRALDKAPRDQARPQIHCSLPPAVLATGRALAASGSSPSSTRHAEPSRSPERAWSAARNWGRLAKPRWGQRRACSSRLFAS
jgi:hypothetical protein